ncbi:hypothetical protein AV530_002823 [Patagioenas fasciata monilis]|uniref:Uncharacterized protein n=1 Tax=Patagioenas fasciata monilis TaxID=372326 RepID=A0A1V4K2W7_PATFA|nr:hypothetical protein AV530_002823 [Patagioenas fasciata monilis]
MFGFCGNRCVEPAGTWSRSIRRTAPGIARTPAATLMSFCSYEVQNAQQIYSVVAKMKDLCCVCLDLYNLAWFGKDPKSLLCLQYKASCDHGGSCGPVCGTFGPGESWLFCAGAAELKLLDG